MVFVVLLLTLTPLTTFILWLNNGPSVIVGELIGVEIGWILGIIIVSLYYRHRYL